MLENLAKSVCSWKLEKRDASLVKWKGDEGVLAKFKLQPGRNE